MSKKLAETEKVVNFFLHNRQSFTRAKARVVVAEFGERVARECARIAARDEFQHYVLDSGDISHDAGNAIKEAILRGFGLSEGDQDGH